MHARIHGKGNTYLLLMGVQKGPGNLDISVAVPQDAVYMFPSRFSYSTFGIYTKYSMSYYGDTYSSMSAAVLFIVARSWTQPGCPFTE